MRPLLCFLFAVVVTAPALEVRAHPEATENSLLGVTVGMSVDDARRHLTPFGIGESRRTREGGLKEVWRLERSGFAWIAFKAAPDRRVVWVTGHRRPDHQIAFEQLTSLRPHTRTDAMAIWYLQGGRGENVRLTARGRDGRAQVMTLMREEW